jgi:hypothetical protein
MHAGYDLTCPLQPGHIRSENPHVVVTEGQRSAPSHDLPLRDSISLRRLSSPLFSFPALPPRLLVVDRRLSNAVHSCLSRVSGCHAHLDQQREPPGLEIVKSILRWPDHLVLPLVAWLLQSVHHRPHVVQSVDIRPDRLIGLADALRHCDGRQGQPWSATVAAQRSRVPDYDTLRGAAPLAGPVE